MNMFKITSLPASEVKFKEWKIRENSKLSIGSAVLIYEYASGKSGIVKTDKIKSTFNEITVKELCKLNPDDILKAGSELFSFEKCKHPITSNEMCAVCGEDLKVSNETSVKKKITSMPSTASNASRKANTNDASVRIVHAEPKIRVSETEALEIGKKDLINLVKNKKLVLLVDLDHTLIHTTNENVRADLKEVHHYELWQKHVWYHTKFRPKCNKFLEEMSKLFELHMVTFGERNYAHTIAKLMDPDHRFFHDRILSRNEIFNPVSKTDNLKDLFPRGDLMVCIIDDREDVWNYARNLICVQPYVFFKNTGDINDPTQSKSSKTTKSIESAKIKTPVKTTKSSELSILTENELAIDNNSVDSSSSTSSTGSSSDSNDKNQQKNSKQNKENHTPVKPEQDDEYDPDDYLIYLENILRNIHDEYYKIYEQRLKSKPSQQTEQVDESDLPDLKRVLPLIKSKVLENVVITFSGVVPTGYDLRKQRCYIMATSLGAKVNEHLVIPDSDEEDDDSVHNSKKYEYSYDDDETSSSSNCSGGARFNEKSKKRYTTHLVAAKHGTSKVHEAGKCIKQKIHVVTPEWLINSNYKWIKCDEKMYKLTKEYDYKNCIFHNEYNMHQKYATAVNSSLMLQSSKLLSTSKRNINNVSNQVSKLETESKTKKYKPNKEEEEDYEINEDLLNIMDKEVDKELDEEDDDEEVESTSDDDSIDSKKNKSDSSTTNDDADLSSNDESIDEDMISALERDFN